METLTLIKKIFDELNENNFFIENYGVLKDRRVLINGEMLFYDSKNHLLDRLIMYRKDNKPDKLSLYVSNEHLFLDDLQQMFGQFEIGYNFRDNYSILSFCKFINYKNVKNFQIKREGNYLSGENFSIKNIIYQL